MGHKRAKKRKRRNKRRHEEKTSRKVVGLVTGFVKGPNRNKFQWILPAGSKLTLGSLDNEETSVQFLDRSCFEKDYH